MSKQIDRKNRPAPKSFPHLAAYELAAKTRRIAAAANNATSGDFLDKLELAFASQDVDLEESIRAVKSAYPKRRGAVAEVISAELASRDTDRRVVAIIVKALRKNRGGRL